MTQTVCPDCGAVLDETKTCQSVFDEFLVLEFSDPVYVAVHFLTVACFMIQHRRYSPDGLKWISEKLRDHLERGVSVQEIWQNAAMEIDQSKRTWHVNLRPGDPIPPKIAWSMTIADVYAKYRDAASYGELITRWALATLEDMQILLPLADSNSTSH